jgi:endonuclease/exonuclease/phosphatase family metal-dependent hydrolase
MPQIKIATFNIEWMVLAFGGMWTQWQSPIIPLSFPGGTVGGVKHEPIGDVHGLCRRVAGVIKGIRAKIIAIQEAPPRKEQMEAFVDQFLDGKYVVHHSNSKWQSISALVHKSIASKVTAWQPDLPEIGQLWSGIPYYPWGLIGVEERKKHRLDRHPLLLSFRPSAGKELRLIILHTKSKFSKLKSKSQWESRDREAVLDALNSRAKLSAEVYRIREFLDKQLSTPPANQSVVLVGDLNDGPFAELMEQEFMIHNIIDELVGSLLYPTLHFRHAMAPEVLRVATTTRFPNPLEGGMIVEELIDHILLSPAVWQENGDFRLKPGSCRVESEVYENHYEDTGETRKRELRPSDHKPVSAILEY